ncbi:hypothetical protein [Flavobacterium sp. I3-2]|uniref:hypothetical protein n=1 Tax=Flavobacterium sp. I3-2 TaxID=2748319 RepID=UPI0015AB3591|nr:hypothetical protein [Flavobacterium sp. I3-2]
MKSKLKITVLFLLISFFYSNAQDAKTTVELIQSSKEKITELNAEAAKIGEAIELKKQDLIIKDSQAKQLAIQTSEAKKLKDKVKTEDAKRVQKTADQEVSYIKKELKNLQKSQKEKLKEAKQLAKSNNSIEKAQKNVTKTKAKLLKADNNLKKTTTQYEKNMLNKKLTLEKEIKAKSKILKLDTQVKELKLELKKNELILQTEQLKF